MPIEHLEVDVNGSPRILIGIATRNRCQILPKAIDSALSQRAPNIDVAIIDDGSDDGTPELRLRYPHVDWTRRSPAEGHMSARNAFMSRPNFDYFVGLDDDAWFLRDDAIALALKMFEQDTSLAAVGFDMASPDKPEIGAFAAAQPAGMFNGCAHMLRLEALRKTGLYEPMPGLYGSEEKDLCLRLMDAGYWVARLPGVGVWHDKTPLARDIPFQHKSGVCNDLVMTIRRSPWFLLPVVLPLKAWRHLTFAWRTDLLAPCLAGMALFTRSMREILAYRKPVRAATLLHYLRLSRVGSS